MGNTDVKVHGTYPYDDYGPGYTSCWRKVRAIAHEEAAKLTGLEVADDGYLWLNKGYIVLGATDQGITGTGASFIENRAKFSKRIPPGTQAVYLADGNYSIIERTDVDQTIRAD